MAPNIVNSSALDGRSRNQVLARAPSPRTHGVRDQVPSEAQVKLDNEHGAAADRGDVGTKHQCEATDRDDGGTKHQGEATLAGESMGTTVNASWWQAVQQHEAAGGFFNQRLAGSAAAAGTAEDHGEGLGDRSIQREEAKRMRFLKASFKLQLGLRR